MEKKRVKCPRCQRILEVANPMDAPVLLVTCPDPQCGAKMRLRFATGKTVLAEAGRDEKKPGCLVYKGKEYPLREGLNIVGRLSQSGKATIQLPTDDLTMSRTHAQIDVRRLNSGRLKAILSDVRDAEKIEFIPITLEDEPLFPEDAIVLANGDVITLGHTKIKYKR